MTAILRRAAVVLGSASMAMASSILPAQTRDTAQAIAPTFIVNSVADVVAAAPLASGPCETATGNGVCTLRAAIMKANHYPGGGATIRFMPGVAQYTLSILQSGNSDDEAMGDLNFDASMTIIGNGMASTVIDGNGAATSERVFFVKTGANVTISGVTIQHGRPLSVAGGTFGGGIANGGTLVLDRVGVVDNTADGLNGFGGGIFNSGKLTLQQSLVSRNATGVQNAYGGGIYNQGELLISDSTISSNRVYPSQAPGNGGGLFNTSSTATIVTIVNSAFVSNHGGVGGAIYLSGNGTSIINTTISNNLSDGAGGGVFASSGTHGLYNVTIAENIANADGTGSASGGGIAVNGGATLSIGNSIVARNSKIVVTGQGLLLQNSECSGTVVSQNTNLFFFQDPGNCIVNGSVTYADPLIGSLHDNGGATFTYALPAGSPAINSGIAGGCTDNLGATITRDQRGAARPYPDGGRCDLGAYEFARVLDVDDSSPSTTYDALTDGLIVLRYMFGLAGTQLTSGAVGASAHRTDSAIIKAYLDAIRPTLDIDGDGNIDALTDGLLALRYMFGLTGSPLTQNAISAGATRTTATQVQTALAGLMP